MKTRNTEAAPQAFRENGGTLRTRDAAALGVHTDVLYALRDQGEIIELGRGLDRLAAADEWGNPDLALAGLRAPQTAVGLISALSYHGITTQIPAAVHLAVPRGSYHGISLSPAPVQVYRFDAKTFEAGLETVSISGVPVYAARSIVDALKFRNKIGLDVAIEALRFGRERLGMKNMDLESFAKLLRMKHLMSPYPYALS